MNLMLKVGCSWFLPPVSIQVFASVIYILNVFVFQVYSSIYFCGHIFFFVAFLVLPYLRKVFVPRKKGSEKKED